MCRDGLSLTVSGPGLAEVTGWQTRSGHAIHIVNHSSSDFRGGPFCGITPIGPQQVSVQLPADLSVTDASGSNLTLVPASDGGDDFIGIGGPDEGLWAFVVLGKEAVDGGLKIDERVEDAFESAVGEPGEEASTALSQEQELSGGNH